MSDINANANADAARHAAKMAKKKALQDERLAKATEQKGLLVVHTGKGKGKSTAAFGMVLRALGHGMRVGVVQFVKGAIATGETAALEAFGDRVSVHRMGEGFTWQTQDRARDVAAAERALAKATEMIASGAYEMVLLDEINIALRTDYLAIGDVLAAIAARPAHVHVIATGRNAKPELIEAADLVTDFTLVKHPFQAGIKPQPGIEF